MHLNSFSRNYSHHHEIKKLKQGCGKIYRAIGGFLHAHGYVTREHHFIDDYGTVQTRYYVNRAEYKADKARDFGRSNTTPIHEFAQVLASPPPPPPPPPVEDIIIHRSLQSYHQAQSATEALEPKFQSHSSNENYPEAHSDSGHYHGYAASDSTLVSDSREPSPTPEGAPTEADLEIYYRVKRYLESQAALRAGFRTSSVHEGVTELHHEDYDKPPHLDSGYTSAASSEAGDLEELSPHLDAHQLSLHVSKELEGSCRVVVQPDSGYNSCASSEGGDLRVAPPHFEEHKLCLEPSDNTYHEAPRLDSGYNSYASSLASTCCEKLPVADSIDIPYSINRYIHHAGRRGAFSGGYSVRP
ncbi:hypothetical protein BZA77DRAFT_367200 [Pyronema omphalodes]|nr:hypothetical protein BZA77DRAFT_367200 [Pyronema omphalodes]